jgi:hypothetical protein
MRFRLPVVNVGAQGMQRHLALNLFFGARNLGTAQAATTNDLDAPGVGAHRLLHRLLHGAAEGNALLQLISNTTRHQISIQFGLANLFDLQAHALPGLRL